MQKLYAAAFQRILNRLGKESIDINSVQNVLKEQGIRDVGNFVYHRLPREQFRNFIKVPCPIPTQSTTDEKSIAIINASKKLRSNFSVDQKKVCSRCPNQQSCSHFAQNVSPDTPNALPDILIFMESLKNKSLVVDDSQIQYRVWKSGYKSCDSILAIIEDLSNGGVQTYEFQKLRLEHIQQKKTEQLESTQLIKQAPIYIEGLTPTKTQQRKQKNWQKQAEKRENMSKKQKKEKIIDVDESDDEEQQYIPDKNKVTSKRYEEIFAQEQKFLNNHEFQEKQGKRNMKQSDENQWGNKRQNRRRDYDDGRRSRVQMKEPRQDKYRRDFTPQGNRDRDWNRNQRGDNRRGRNDWEPDTGRRSYNRDNDYQNRGTYRNKSTQRNNDNNRYSNNKGQQRRQQYNTRNDNNRYSNNKGRQGRQQYNRNNERNTNTKGREGRQQYNSEDLKYQQFIDNKFERAGNQYKPSQNNKRQRRTNEPVYQQWDTVQTFKRSSIEPSSEKVTIKDVQYTSEKRTNGDQMPVRRGRNVRK